MIKEKSVNKGKAFIGIGVLLILVSLIITGLNKYNDLNAGKQAQAALDIFKSEVIPKNHIVDSLIPNETKEMKTIFFLIIIIYI